MPRQVIDTGISRHRLVSHVVLAKYLKHRPLYRVQQELARIGLEIMRATLADWVTGVGTAIWPLYCLVRDALLSGG